MKRMQQLIVAFAVLVMPAAALAGPLNADHVPDNVKYVVHVDVRAMLNSDFGKLMIEKKNEMGLTDKLTAAEAYLGLNPLYDFQGATLFGHSFEEDDATLLVYLDDDTGKLRDLVQKADGYELHRYRDHEIHSYVERKRRGKAQRKYAGVHAEQGVSGYVLIFSSDKKEVEASIDLIMGQGRQTLATREDHVTATDPSAGSWIFVAGSDLSNLPERGRRAKISRMLNELVIDLGENAADQVTLDVTMNAQDEPRATAGRQMIEGAMAMCKVGDEGGDATDLLDAIQITQNDTTVNLSFQYDAEKLFEKMQTMKDKHKKRFRHRHHERSSKN